MIEIPFYCCAGGAAIDQQTNELSVFNVLHGITAVGFPVLVQGFVIVALIRRDVTTDKSKLDASFSLTLNGTPLAPEVKTVVDFEDKPTSRLVLRLQGLIVKEPGKLEATLTLDAGEGIAPVVGRYQVLYESAEPALKLPLGWTFAEKPGAASSTPEAGK